MPDKVNKLLARVPALRRLLCQNSLLEYSKAVMPNFQSPPHILCLIKFWEAIESGSIRRGLVAIPPRHGKSLQGILAAAWILGRHPDWQIAVASYGAELSETWGRKVRAILGSAAHQGIFPTCRLSADSAAAHRFELTRGGGARFVGRGGALLGTGARLLIGDDLYANAEEARSESVKCSAWEWFTEVFLTRLEPGGAAVIIGSRWAQDDIIGRLMREHASEGWELVHLPAIAESDDPLGRSEGAALWRARYDEAALEGIRRQMGSSAFMNLFQGRPAAAEGVIFLRPWFRLYRDPLPSFQKIVQSWDTAYGKSKNAGDYSVCTTWGVNNNGYYLLSLWRGRVDFPTLKRLVGQQAQEWKPYAIYIEDCASGQSLIQELRSASIFPVIPVKVDHDKQTRAEAVTAMFEAGRVFFPADAAWRADLEDELASFPVAAHDDQVDSVAMALNCLRESASQPLSILTSESQYSIAGLRRYLSGDPRKYIPPGLGQKILDGGYNSLTAEEEWALMLGDIADLLK